MQGEGGGGGELGEGNKGFLLGKKLFVRYSFVILFSKEILYSGI